MIEMTQYTKAFTKMAVAGCITAVLPEHTRSSTDRYFAAEEKEAEKYMIATSKDLQAIKKAAQAQIEAEAMMTEGIGLVIALCYPPTTAAHHVHIYIET